MCKSWDREHFWTMLAVPLHVTGRGGELGEPLRRRVAGCLSEMRNRISPLSDHLAPGENENDLYGNITKGMRVVSAVGARRGRLEFGSGRRGEGRSLGQTRRQTDQALGPKGFTSPIVAICEAYERGSRGI